MNFLYVTLWLFLMAINFPLAHAQAGSGFKSLKELRESGVVIQKWEYSCAAASLASVLTYSFNDPVSEKHVSSEMLKNGDPEKVRRMGGFSLADLKHFVERRGYSGRAYKHLAFEDLLIIDSPIIPIHQYGYNHYVVVKKVLKDAVLIGDPAFGNRVLPKEEFEKQWIDGMAFVITKL
jgi:predicted double-glycine peptidase